MHRSLIFFLCIGSATAWQWSDILGKEKTHTVQKIKRQPMQDIPYEKREALAQINAIRMGMGMPPLQENSKLAYAAQAHANYLVRHHLSSHYEKAGMEGFAGTKPFDRALRAGYKSRFVGENLSTKNNSALDSINGLFSAIYHRFGFLNIAFDEVGIGIAQKYNDARNSAFVYEMGNREIDHLCRLKSFHGTGRYVYGVCANSKHRIEAKRYRRAQEEIKELSPKIILYPYDGQDDVLPAFYDETPDPLPDYDVSGFPISVEFNDRFFRKVDLISFKLYVEKGDQVSDVRLLDRSSDPNHRLTRRQFALLPLKRLDWGRHYRAEVQYRHNKKQHKIVWKFTTRKPIEPLKTITQKETTLSLEHGRGYWLYFPPRDPHDILKTMHYPADLYVKFIDANTMRVVLDKENMDSFVIKGSGRKVHIDVR